jgi:excisionase family DNA binding protein
MLLRVREAAARLQVCRATLYRIVEAGDLEPVKLGRSTRFRAEDIDRIARQGCGTRRQAE